MEAEDILDSWTAAPIQFTTLPPISPRDLHTRIRALPLGKSAGPSGLRAEHLRRLRPPTQQSLARLLDVILEGHQLGLTARRLLSNCFLTVLKKPTSTATELQCRPIAVPDVLRKLAGQLLLQRLRPRLAEFLAPIQVGIALPGGSELAVLPTRLALQREAAGLLTVDFANAFNTVSRQVVLDIWARVFPEAHPFVKAIYADSPRVYTNSTDGSLPPFIEVREGVQQGDPLGPSLFACGLQLLLATVRARDRQVTEATHLSAYLDDVTVVGPPAEVGHVLQSLRTFAPAFNLQLRDDKCEWWRDPTYSSMPLPPNLDGLRRQGGTKQLAVPVGDPIYMQGQVQLLLDRHRHLLDELVLLADRHPQAAMVLLRYCVGPKFIYWLRTLPFGWGHWLATRADRQTLQTVERMLQGWGLPRNSPRRSMLNRRIPLPTSMGGLGLANNAHLHHAAVIAAWTNTVYMLVQHGDPLLETFRQQVLRDPEILPLATLREASELYIPAQGHEVPHNPPVLLELRMAMAVARDWIARWPTQEPMPVAVRKAQKHSSWRALLADNSHLPSPTLEDRELEPLEDQPLPFSPPMYLQHLLTRAVHWVEKCKLESEGDIHDRAQLKSQGSLLSGLWLQLVPSQWRHRMEPEVFRYALRLYLGAHLPAIGPPTTLNCRVCDSDLDPFGIHWLTTCPTMKGLRTRLHTTINHTLRRALHQAGYTTILEPHLGAPLEHPETTTTPGLRADLLVFGHEGGRDVFVDVSVTNPLSPSFIRWSHQRRGYCANRRYREKVTKYDAAVRQLGDPTGAPPLFVPFVLESLGLLHDASHKWLQNIFSGHPDVRTALYGELSWTLWKRSGNNDNNNKFTLSQRRQDSGKISDREGSSPMFRRLPNGNVWLPVPECSQNSSRESRKARGEKSIHALLDGGLRYWSGLRTLVWLPRVPASSAGVPGNNSRENASLLGRAIASVLGQGGWG